MKPAFLERLDEPHSEEALEASRQLYRLFWTLSTPGIVWILYLWIKHGILTADPANRFQAMMSAQREFAHAMFTPAGIGLWLICVGILIRFLLGPVGRKARRSDRLWISLAIGAGFLSIVLRLLGVTSPP